MAIKKKRNGIILFAETWMNPEIITLSKVRKRKTNIKWYHLYVKSKLWHWRPVVETQHFQYQGPEVHRTQYSNCPNFVFTTQLILFLQIYTYICICIYIWSPISLLKRVRILQITDKLTFPPLKWKLLSCIQLFVTPWTIQSMEFSRPEHWSGQPFPSPGNLPNPGIEPRSPTLQADSLPIELSGKAFPP